MASLYTRGDSSQTQTLPDEALVFLRHTGISEPLFLFPSPFFVFALPVPFGAGAVSHDACEARRPKNTSERRPFKADVAVDLAYLSPEVASPSVSVIDTISRPP